MKKETIKKEKIKTEVTSKETIKQEVTTKDSGKKKISKAEVFRALKFVGFSISAGVIQIGTFEILYDAIHWLWWPSYLISIVLSVIWNFTFNRKFTFKSANNVPIAMMWTLLYYAAFIPASVFGGQALEDVGWNGTLVEALMMVINFVTEFLWQRFFVFRNSIDTNSKTVEMKLDLQPFESIKNGTKTVEMRVNDEKRKSLKVGDHIIFSQREDENNKIKVVIKKIKKFSTFAELYAAYDKTKLGYGAEDEAKPEDMEKYYSKEDMADGVLAIEIKLAIEERSEINKNQPQIEEKSN